jgi:hypothetical protein
MSCWQGAGLLRPRDPHQFSAPGFGAACLGKRLELAREVA